jgi:hypothetical protein
VLGAQLRADQRAAEDVQQRVGVGYAETASTPLGDDLRADGSAVVDVQPPRALAARAASRMRTACAGCLPSGRPVCTFTHVTPTSTRQSTQRTRSASSRSSSHSVVDCAAFST